MRGVFILIINLILSIITVAHSNSAVVIPNICVNIFQQVLFFHPSFVNRPASSQTTLSAVFRTSGVYTLFSSLEREG